MTAADLPCIAQLVEHANTRYRVACVRDAALWHYEVFGKREQNTTHAVVCLIDAPIGESVGFLAHPARLFGSTQVTWVYELKPGVSWAAVTPSVIRYLHTIGEAYATRDQGECSAFGFWLGRTHPVYDAMRSQLPDTRRLYAWYLRVPDLPGFLWHVAPALETAAGHLGGRRVYRRGETQLLSQRPAAGAPPWQPAGRRRRGRQHRTSAARRRSLT